ncbi:Core 1 synthase, glycoprotein-N-acetylgalactosamine 3-beta-galactosyltransferase, 1 [Cichlidogyrus casuarinus]|uniref:N-acetylgalactosaminide beta-1,3-galactosyltransferase n=1 Tax=Cichlidogyrus casuarinus TaxID=1844966 RepID=A0ABD2Q211_9PLAT
MCFILTQPKNSAKARMVNSTWAPLCDDYIFVTGNETIPELPCLSVPVIESRDSLTEKIAFMILHLHKKHGHKYDFFLKADDDTYILMDNLRDFLRELDPLKKILAGRRFKKFTKQGYMAGGAGYLISQAGLHAIAETLENDEKPCHQNSNSEDVGFGYCAERAGVEIVDSLDQNHLERFHPFPLPGMWWLEASQPFWIHDYNYYPLKYPKNSAKAKMVNSTWAPLCDDYIFVTGNETIPELPCLTVPVIESRKSLMAKTIFMILHLHKKHGHKYDFFLKADDDTYILIDNLREFLRDLDPQNKILAGRRFKKFTKQGYMSGGAGYLISQAGLHAIAETMENDEKPCHQNSNSEDVGLGYCAERAGVEIVDSLDRNHLERFHPFNLPAMWLLEPTSDNWIHEYNYHPMKYVSFLTVNFVTQHVHSNYRGHNAAVCGRYPTIMWNHRICS